MLAKISKSDSVTLHERRIPHALRIFALITSLVAGIGGTLLFGLFVIPPFFLACGAIAAGRSPRRARWLMWVGAVFLSVFTLPFGVAMLLHASSDALLAKGIMFLILALVST